MTTTTEPQTYFPNKAGDHADTDEILRDELRFAGIQTLQEAEGKGPEFMQDILRRSSGEVKTSVIGCLHGWEFKRSWYYWRATGPGIEVDAAEALHATHGKDVRVAGHAGCPSPKEWYKGLACGDYHIDTREGLLALADTIKGLVQRKLSVSSKKVTLEKKTGYFVTGCTGCSCCESDNFASGPFETLNDAWVMVDYYTTNRTVRSQYSHTGIYEVSSLEYEILDGQRMLIEGEVLINEPFYQEESMYKALCWSSKKTVFERGVKNV